MRVFENRVLRNILGPKTDEVTGQWRRFPNEKFYDLYSSLNIVRVIKSRKIRRPGHVACTGYRSGGYRVLAGKPEKRRPLGSTTLRCEDNIK